MSREDAAGRAIVPSSGWLPRIWVRSARRWRSSPDRARREVREGQRDGASHRGPRATCLGLPVPEVGKALSVVACCLDALATWPLLCNVTGGSDPRETFPAGVDVHAGYVDA